MSPIGFLINPISGMGGKVGLKGTDDVVARAIELGARPTAHLRAGESLRKLRSLVDRSASRSELRWVSCAGAMGGDALRSSGFRDFEEVYATSSETSGIDTIDAVAMFLETGVDLVFFCGGDGTARDICSVTGEETPILGIPAGVKMYSGVFGINPVRTAEILFAFLEGKLSLTTVDILDLDEAQYRKGIWAVRLYSSARTPFEPTLTQSAKMLISETTDPEVKQEIADYLREEVEADPAALFLLGPGSTVRTVAQGLGIEKTLLGVDAVAGGEPVGADLNEQQLLALLDRFPRTKLILSPIGAQGFVLGRGNLQISPKIVGRVGRHNIVVVATPAKLARTPVLRFDTGEAELDAELCASGFIPVVIGYRLRRLVRAAI